jgi:hypothetical protein
MAKLKGDSLAVLEYFTSGAFSNSDAVGRTNYYSITSVPRAKFNGRRQVIGGSDATFNQYHNAYLLELGFPSACLLDIFVDYDSTTRNLKVKSRVTAVDTFENARIRYAIAESHIQYKWGGPPPSPELDSVHHVVRKMLPNYVGVSIPAMNPNDTFIDSQTYTLPIPATDTSCCDDTNCYVVVFVQDDDDPTHPVFRSAKSGLFLTWVYGDANGDSTVNVADIVYLVTYLFLDGPAPDPRASGDANYDCVLDIGDAVYLVTYVFMEGPEPQKGCAW